MLDKYQEKQNIAYRILKNAITKNKTSHAYLFEANGVKDAKDIAISFAKGLLCPNKYTNNNNCVNCTQCQNIDKNCFLELKIISPDGMWIKKEQLDELQKEFSMKSVESDKKVYIIENADRLNASSANTILKFLEEPSENIIAILLTDNIYNCIDTIVSRCQILSLKNPTDKINDNLYKKHLNDEDLSEFITNVNKNVISFYNTLEKQKEETIVFYDTVYFKEKIELLLTIGLYLYIEVLNTKYERNINNLIEFEEEIKNISINNETSDIIKKIEIINDFLRKNNFNVNKELFLDNFIITFSGGIK